MSVFFTALIRVSLIGLSAFAGEIAISRRRIHFDDVGDFYDFSI